LFAAPVYRWDTSLLATATVAVIAVLASTAAQAGTPTPKVLDGQGQLVATYGGWAAWSRPDAATNAFALVLRSPAGAISLAPVATSPAPFDVELGPSDSGVAAVYSRCADTSTLQGCHIYYLRLGVAGATEQILAVPGSSVHEPAIWNGRLVYLRPNPTGGERRPDDLLEWQIGSGDARSIALPASRGLGSQAGGRWPKGVTGTITGLTLRGRQIAYSTVSGHESFGIANLWLQNPTGAPRLIDQVTSGASATCTHEFISPILLGGWLYAYLHDCDPYADPASDRWTRYSLTTNTAQRAKFTFVHTGDELINSVVPDGRSVDWAGESGLERLPSIAWHTIPRPVPETFCTLAHPIC
jgi:hypothetical protein